METGSISLHHIRISQRFTGKIQPDGPNRQGPEPRVACGPVSAIQKHPAFFTLCSSTKSAKIYVIKIGADRKLLKKAGAARGAPLPSRNRIGMVPRHPRGQSSEHLGSPAVHKSALQAAGNQCPPKQGIRLEAGWNRDSKDLSIAIDLVPLIHTEPPFAFLSY
jgi:hypothetical protein